MVRYTWEGFTGDTCRWSSFSPAFPPAADRAVLLYRTSNLVRPDRGGKVLLCEMSSWVETLQRRAMVNTSTCHLSSSTFEELFGQSDTKLFVGEPYPPGCVEGVQNVAVHHRQVKQIEEGPPLLPDRPMAKAVVG